MSGTSDELSKMSKSNDDEEDQISEMLSQQIIEDLSNNEKEIAVCANCGKEGINLNVCNKCKEATYCNAGCKKKKRSIASSIKRNVSGVLLSYTMKRSSKNLLLNMGIVPSALYVCQLWLVEDSTCRAVGKEYVVDAAMLMCMIIMAK